MAWRPHILRMCQLIPVLHPVWRFEEEQKVQLVIAVHSLLVTDHIIYIHIYHRNPHTHNTQHTHARTADRAGLDHASMNENLEHIFENQNMLGLLFYIYVSYLSCQITNHIERKKPRCWLYWVPNDSLGSENRYRQGELTAVNAHITY